MSVKNTKKEQSAEVINKNVIVDVTSGDTGPGDITFRDFLTIADGYINRDGMGEFSLQYGDMAISFSSVSAKQPVYHHSGPVPHADTSAVVAASAGSQYREVKSNMVGTLYTAASPTDSPYISVGSEIKEGQTIFIIEAMKVMSHFKAPFSGVVKEILVQNEEVVEYGKVLVRVA